MESRAKEHSAGLVISEAMINSYLDNQLTPKQNALIEKLISEDEKLLVVLKRKTEEKKHIHDLIPQQALLKKERRELMAEISDINEGLLQSKKESLLKRVGRILDTTIIEF